MDLGESLVYDSTQDLPVTLTKAKSVLGQSSLCNQVRIQDWRCHLVNLVDLTSPIPSANTPSSPLLPFHRALTRRSGKGQCVQAAWVVVSSPSCAQAAL